MRPLIHRLTRRLIQAAVLAGSSGIALAAHAAIPDGFTPLFDGKSLKGWHVSRSSHHGTDPEVLVKNGELLLGQNPYGVGGLLLTDRHFRNFELYLEVNATPGCDSGVFLRSGESGNAYQISLDEPGVPSANGNLEGEGRRLSRVARNQTDAWKVGKWNTLRIRVTGDAAPRIAMWMNDQPLWDVQQDPSTFFTDLEGGSIALQSHFNASWPGGPSPRWVPGAHHRFRNIAIKELP